MKTQKQPLGKGYATDGIFDFDEARAAAFGEGTQERANAATKRDEAKRMDRKTEVPQTKSSFPGTVPAGVHPLAPTAQVPE